MPKLRIHIDNHGKKCAVSEMRRRLASILSKLDGGQEVTFIFIAKLEDYQLAKPVAAPHIEFADVNADTLLKESVGLFPAPFYEIYDKEFSRRTGFGVFQTEQAAHAFLDLNQKRRPELYRHYQVRVYQPSTTATNAPERDHPDIGSGC